MIFAHHYKQFFPSKVGAKQAHSSHKSGFLQAKDNLHWPNRGHTLVPLNGLLYFKSCEKVKMSAVTCSLALLVGRVDQGQLWPSHFSSIA